MDNKYYIIRGDRGDVIRMLRRYYEEGTHER